MSDAPSRPEHFGMAAASARASGRDGWARRSESQRNGLIRACAALVAVIASFLSVEAICRLWGAGADAAVLAAILAIGLARRPPAANRRELFAAPFVLTGIALTAVGVGSLFRTYLPLGALAFIAAMFVSIWLRNFGGRARSAGALIALPLVAMLVVPVRETAPGGRLVDVALVVCAGIIPLAYVAVLHWLARRAGIPLVAAEPAPARSTPRKAGISVPSRMAVQMAVALAAAFCIGFIVFPGHWGWTVLTAYIVCGGARGRGDALYKGVLRLVGAAAGTLAAVALGSLWAPAGVAEACAIFTVLFFGLWLRAVNYAYWAACMTLILALLADSGGGKLSFALFGVRLEAIFAGAICAVAAAWFVLPIRTEAVVRRRIADALAALDELVTTADLSAAERAVRLLHFEHRIAELSAVAPPVRWHRRFFTSAPEHPARWIDLTYGLHDHARVVATQGWRDAGYRAAVRRAIGVSRRAIAKHGNSDPAVDAPPVSVALLELHNALIKDR